MTKPRPRITPHELHMTRQALIRDQEIRREGVVVEGWGDDSSDCPYYQFSSRVFVLRSSELSRLIERIIGRAELGLVNFEVAQRAPHNQRIKYGMAWRENGDCDLNASLKENKEIGE